MDEGSASLISFFVICLLELSLGEYVIDTQYYDDELDCPEVNSTYVGPHPHPVPWGVPFRAYKTLPKGLSIEPSKIEGAGYGVISETFIKAHTWLGEYEGEIVEAEQQEEISWYTWTAHRDGTVTHYVDAHNFETSNYMRWINCARNRKEENVLVAECRGKIYYIVIKDIYPRQELLVYYGSTYGLELGNVNVDEFDY